MGEPQDGWSDDGWRVERLDDGTFVVADTALGWAFPQPLSRAEMRALWDVMHEALTDEHRREAAPVNYGGHDPSVECAYPPCSNRLRRSDLPGPQWCSKEHRSLTPTPDPEGEA